MTQLEYEMLSELSEAQNFVYELSENLNTQGVAASGMEGLDTLVPKVLQIESGGDVEHDDTLNKNINPDFLHINAEEKALITSTAGIVSEHTEDIADLQANKANTSHTHTKSEVGLSNVDNTSDVNKPISNATQTALNGKADKATTLSGYGITNAYTKTEIDNKISAVFRYKGSVSTLVELNALTGMVIGDVYNVTETGDNYAWTGTEWDKLSGEIDLSAYLTINEASNKYETIENVQTLNNTVSGHTGDISDLEENKVDKTTDILYADLLALIANGGLVPGQSYRITDYTTTTTQADTQSAGHDFDIIVTALSTNELSENAKCVRKSDDTYFENAKLEAWEIKYCIDNDTSRFAWADTVNGKGVIYYMKDEWNNECPYDFKNIQFKRYPILTAPNNLSNLIYDADNQKVKYGSTSEFAGISPHNCTIDENNPSWCYTFNAINMDTGEYEDCTILAQKETIDDYYNRCDSNIIEPFHILYAEEISLPQRLNNIVLFGIYSIINEQYFEVYSNTFGNYCNSNTFGNYCNSNTFGDNCSSNTFGNNCYSNTFGNYCYSNTFGNYCNSNTFGDNCSSNTFGNNCYSNTFGNYCYSNNFYDGTTGTTKKDYIKYVVLEDGCRYNNFYSTLTTSGLSYLQRIRIKGLENSTPTNIQITLSETNTKYEWVICYTSGGTLKQYCPDDRLTNKIEDTIVSSWAASTAYAGYGYQAQINIPNLTENDIVNVTFSGVDVISGNYYPTIEIYEGYILVFAKVNVTITIPTIEITKIDL